MLSATFVGEVHQGRVSVPMPEFEGKKVRVTLTVTDPLPAVIASEEAEILEDIGLIGLPPDETTVMTARITDVEAPPMRVYPEEE